MSPTVPPLRLHRAAAVEALRAGPLRGDAEQRVYSGRPPNADTIPTPYAVVSGYIGITTGTNADPNADCQFVAQAKCVGWTDDESEGLADDVMAIWLDPARWSIPGRDVSHCDHDLVRTTGDQTLSGQERSTTDVLVRVFTSPA